MQITASFYQKLEEKKLNKHELLRQKFEDYKYSSINHLEDNKVISEDYLGLYDSDSKINNDDDIKMGYDETKKVHDRKIQEQVKAHSEKLADMILDIDCSELIKNIYII